MASTTLARLYMDNGGDRLPPWSAGEDGLEAFLQEELAQARVRLGELEVSTDAWVAALAAVTSSNSAPPPPEAIEEVALAVACARGDASAQRLFETRYFGAVRAAVARFPLPSDALDEIQQTVRERLFVAREDGQPRILRYAGRGGLGGLVRAAAVRIVLDRLRARQRQRKRNDAAHDAQFGNVSLLSDPELACVRADRRAAFKEAFEAAVAALRPRERGVLRLQTLSGLSIDQLAHIYDVHRSSVVRWLAHARSSIASHTRRQLEFRFRIPAKEVDAMLSTITRGGDLSLSRIFGQPTEGPP